MIVLILKFPRPISDVLISILICLIKVDVYQFNKLPKLDCYKPITIQNDFDLKVQRPISNFHLKWSYDVMKYIYHKSTGWQK